MAYDAQRKTIVLFGGASKGAEMGDTWLYDGKTWKQLEIEGPSPREDAAMAWDPASKMILLYGGNAGSGKPALNDTWHFDGKAWKKLETSTQPGVNSACGIATSGDGVILAGGMSSGTSASECWRWDGKAWTRLQSGFGARHGAGLAAEGKGDKVILFGGAKVDEAVGDTWELTAKK
jgi:hypothetical protein